MREVSEIPVVIPNLQGQRFMPSGMTVRESRDGATAQKIFGQHSHTENALANRITVRAP